MIDDKKLLCAFIYSAYDSGYCGLALGEELKQKHMQLYRDYIKNKDYFPEKEINETQRLMRDSIKNTGIRDYIYNGHFEIVKKRIEKETRNEFRNALKSPFVLHAAVNCPVNFYKVLASHENEILAENIFLKNKRELVILSGLEKPNVGDLVSGHWNYMLEIVDEWEDLEKYKNISKEYIYNLNYINK